MIKNLLSEQLIGMLGISITIATGMLAYQIMVDLFLQAIVDSLNTAPH
jgi:hypothetical protein